MQEPLVLYSTNTWLAYMIAQRYYNSEHYVWCTPFFDPKSLTDLDSAVPPTSSPLDVYWRLHDEVSRRDRHSDKIKANRVGILRGANAKKQQGIIDENQEKQIVSIVDLASHEDFLPLLYIIPFSGVAHCVKEPAPEDKAHPLSAEYIIPTLPRRCFDVIELGKGR